jgi:hypothetical protein
MQVPDLPANSQIQARSDLDGMTLFWKKPGAGPARYIVVGFLCFWLTGWFGGLVFAGRQLIVGEGPRLFLAAWLTAWLFGGLFAGGMVYLFIRPQKPESVKLERYRLVYDAGTPSLHAMSPHYMMRKKQSLMGPWALLFRKRKTYEFSRSECPEFVLEGLGDEQRLRFDDGAERVTIGEFLTEPEREWLAQVLEAWRNA